MSYLPPAITPEMLASQRASEQRFATERAARAAEDSGERIAQLVTLTETNVQLARQASENSERVERFTRRAIASLVIAIASLAVAVGAVVVTLALAK